MLDRLAFVDLETSGPSPARDRIVEIGVVSVDAGGVRHWSTLLDSSSRSVDRPWNRPKYAASAQTRPPRFLDIAETLAGLLEGRLVVAHNARFDCNFLRAEFARARMHFQPTVLCSLSLSRKLYPQCARHDLDSISRRHGLSTSIRHRALPDADLVRQFWESMRSDHPAGTLAATVEELIAAPVYPSHLDRALIDRLPEGPGVYVFHDGSGQVIDAGAAYNLKRQVQNYFRLDCLSARASLLSHQIADIRCKTTRGPIGARLELAARPEWQAAGARVAADLHSWHFTPERTPALSIRALDDALIATGQSYGVFRSARRARNALHRLAARRTLCLHALGIAAGEDETCARCAENHRPPCIGKAGRLRELVRVSTAISQYRNPAWPFAGPVGLPERGTIHVLDRWRHVGSAATDSELRTILSFDVAAEDLNVSTYNLVRRLVMRHPDRLLPLERPSGSANE